MVYEHDAHFLPLRRRAPPGCCRSRCNRPHRAPVATLASVMASLKINTSSTPPRHAMVPSPSSGRALVRPLHTRIAPAGCDHRRVVLPLKGLCSSSVWSEVSPSSPSDGRRCCRASSGSSSGVSHSPDLPAPRSSRASRAAWPAVLLTDRLASSHALVPSGRAHVGHTVQPLVSHSGPCVARSSLVHSRRQGFLQKSPRDLWRWSSMRCWKP
mmetsp:Transcript_97105/g.273903  ORF Transcript_97105/g.273903 Transcript_97105/m.273903 type:complete len:212 (-) Transcript_97105:457-1092(-)